MILVDLDGTLVPYANEHNHVYRCECGNEFKPCNLDLGLPVSCSSCGGTSFKRDESSLDECRLFLGELFIRTPPPYPGTPEIMRRISKRHPITYITTREEIFFHQTRGWLITNSFPYTSLPQLLMREVNNRDRPYDLKDQFIRNLRSPRVHSIIDDDLSLISLAKRWGIQFVWAPTCWQEKTYYGDLLRHICSDE